jgi:hypothetical protein
LLLSPDTTVALQCWRGWNRSALYRCVVKVSAQHVSEVHRMVPRDRQRGTVYPSSAHACYCHTCTAE